MLTDLRTLEDNAHFDTPVVVLGAGVAGLTVTRRLLQQGWPVLLVESGGLDFEAPIQQLAAGQVIGHPYYDLDSITLRMIGGTTAIWGGRCAELDPLDFEKRSWVPHSGWPFAYGDLQPYYQQAIKMFEAPPPAEARGPMQAALPVLGKLQGGDTAVDFWSLDEVADRFTAPRIRDITDHPKCQVLIHATATSLDLAADGQTITGIKVKDISGKRATIQARQVILALGGVENPRLLLASNDVAPAGIGNVRDLVGRFFMEHPHARGGHVTGEGMWQLLRSLGRRRALNGANHAALLRMSDEAQGRLGTLNSALTLGLRQPENARQALVMRVYAPLKHDLHATNTNRRLWRLTKGIARRLNDMVFPLRPWLHVTTGRGQVAAIVRAEQAPNPDSRVVLGSETDAVGLRRANLDWNLGALDKHSVKCLMESLDSTLRANSLGRAVKASWLDDMSVTWRTDPKISAHPIGGYHHMGTTRMSDDPSQGVADSRCRVHGIANLHIAGSSLFPTSGWANPTLTIAALALRLGDTFGPFAG